MKVKYSYHNNAVCVCMMSGWGGGGGGEGGCGLKPDFILDIPKPTSCRLHKATLCRINMLLLALDLQRLKASSNCCSHCNWFVKLHTSSHPEWSEVINSGSVNTLSTCETTIHSLSPSYSFFIMKKLHQFYWGRQPDGFLGNSCNSETGDLLTASQYVLVCGSVFITPFATFSTTTRLFSWTLQLQFMFISEEAKHWKGYRFKSLCSSVIEDNIKTARVALIRAVHAVHIQYNIYNAVHS